MNEFDSDTPAEELPGILGYQFDDHDFVSLSEATDVLSYSFIRDFDEQTWLLENELPVKVTLNSIETDFIVKPKIPLFELMDELIVKFIMHLVMGSTFRVARSLFGVTWK